MKPATGNLDAEAAHAAHVRREKPRNWKTSSLPAAGALARASNTLPALVMRSEAGARRLADRVAFDHT
jgi:hypothetical protein